MGAGDHRLRSTVRSVGDDACRTSGGLYLGGAAIGMDTTARSVVALIIAYS